MALTCYVRWNQLFVAAGPPGMLALTRPKILIRQGEVTGLGGGAKDGAGWGGCERRGCSKDPAGLGVSLEENGVFIHLHMMEGGGDNSSEWFPVSAEHPLPFSVYLPVSVSLSVCLFLPCSHLHGCTKTNKQQKRKDEIFRKQFLFWRKQNILL